MKRALLTGMSGTGKSTVIQELVARGYPAVDADEEGWSELVAVSADELTGLGPGLDWVWREDRIQQLLFERAGRLAISQRMFAQPGQVLHPVRTHHSADCAGLPDRPATGHKTTNSYGKDPQELDRTLALQQTIEPLLRRAADLEIGTSAPLDQVVATILRHIQH